jgi:hypothetical protein
VTFRYKSADEDGSRPLQYGLIAEDVAELFPELVVYGAQGEPETVSYHHLSTLLLNEFQKQQQIVQAQEIRITELEKKLAALSPPRE